MKTRYTIRTGFKVCYKEKNSKTWIRHWLAKTYAQAVDMLNYYQRYPQHSREDNHLLKNPKWKIIPVSINEVIAGIWLEDPF